MEFGQINLSEVQFVCLKRYVDGHTGPYLHGLQWVLKAPEIIYKMFCIHNCFFFFFWRERAHVLNQIWGGSVDLPTAKNQRG